MIEIRNEEPDDYPAVHETRMRSWFADDQQIDADIAPVDFFSCHHVLPPAVLNGVAYHCLPEQPPPPTAQPETFVEFLRTYGIPIDRFAFPVCPTMTLIRVAAEFIHEAPDMFASACKSMLFPRKDDIDWFRLNGLDTEIADIQERTKSLCLRSQDNSQRPRLFYTRFTEPEEIDHTWIPQVRTCFFIQRASTATTVSTSVTIRYESPSSFAPDRMPVTTWLKEVPPTVNIQLTLFEAGTNRRLAGLDLERRDGELSAELQELLQNDACSVDSHLGERIYFDRPSSNAYYWAITIIFSDLPND